MRTQQQSARSHERSATAFEGAQRAGRSVVHVPTPMLRDMQKQAKRLDQSVSWCVRMAWNMASPDIRRWSAHDPTPQSRLLRGRKRAEAMSMPSNMWFELSREAARLDRSRSWLVQQAWLLARPELLGAMR